MDKHYDEASGNTFVYTKTYGPSFLERMRSAKDQTDALDLVLEAARKGVPPQTMKKLRKAMTDRIAQLDRQRWMTRKVELLFP